MSARISRLDDLRAKAAAILSAAGSEPTDSQISTYKSILDDFFEAGGGKEDMIVRIGEHFFDYFVKGGSHDRSYQGIPVNPLNLNTFH
jgi:hypothetical protein